MHTIVSELASVSFEYCSPSIFLSNAQPNRSVSRMFQDNNAKKLINKYLNKAYRYLNRINNNLADPSLSFKLSDDHRMAKCKHSLSVLQIEKAKLMSLIAMARVRIAQLETMVASEDGHEARVLQLIERDLAAEKQCLAEYERDINDYDKRIATSVEHLSVQSCDSIKAKYKLINEASKMMDSLDDISEQVLSRYPDVEIFKNKEPKSSRLMNNSGMG